MTLWREQPKIQSVCGRGHWKISQLSLSAAAAHALELRSQRGTTVAFKSNQQSSLDYR